MSKTLSESAAEILKASMSAAKEPASKLPAEMDDLGGQTPTTAPSDIGKKASAAASVAAKPATKGDAKAVKTQAMEETEADETAEVVAEVAEEPAAEEVVAEEEVATEEAAAEEVVAEAKAKMEDDEEDDEDEEDEKEMKEAWKNDMKKKHAKSMAEDVDALFNGESLSEEFKTKATTIFEAAVNSRVDAILEDMMTENETVLAEAVDTIKSEIAEQVDEYLNYVVEQWVESNQVAIETGLRAELVDDFISGLKNLFSEHYIEIPEEKVDVAEELAQRVAALEEAATAAAAEKAAIVEELNVAKKNEAIRKICEGLTEVQVEKMKSLAEGVEFTTEGEFDNKLAVLRENYFPAKKVMSEVKAIQETAVEEPEVAEVHGLMKHYVAAITKTAPKA
jgi:hypothetical protein